MAAVKDIALEVKQAIKDDNVVVNAAGVAFFGLLALVPTLLALVSIYGLARDPAEVEEQIGDLLESAPEEIREFISSQLEALAASSSGSLGLTVAISILIALWSASGAVKHLLATLNEIFGFTETRRFLELRGTSYFFTLGAVVLLAGTIFLLGVLPGVLASTDLGATGRFWIGVLRFPLLLVIMALSLSVLYLLGPDRPSYGRYRAVTVGAASATIAWLVGSSLFSIYTANIGRLNETYAATGGLVILLMFLLLTTFCVLLGAEIDSVRQHRARAERHPGDEPAPAGPSAAPAPAQPVAPTHAPATAAPAPARHVAPTPAPARSAALGGVLLGVAVGFALGRRS